MPSHTHTHTHTHTQFNYFRLGTITYPGLYFSIGGQTLTATLTLNTPALDGLIVNFTAPGTTYIPHPISVLISLLPLWK